MRKTITKTVEVESTVISERKFKKTAYVVYETHHYDVLDAIRFSIEKNNHKNVFSDDSMTLLCDEIKNRVTGIRIPVGSILREEKFEDEEESYFYIYASDGDLLMEEVDSEDYKEYLE